MGELAPLVVTAPDDSTPPAPRVIYLKDYTPPTVGIDNVQLNIQLFDDHALVHSRLAVNNLQPEKPVFLNGQDLELLDIRINGSVPDAVDYRKDELGLTLYHQPASFVLETTVRIHPAQNTALEGLYYAGEDLYVTQNEPEGFRKITFFPDRPDVLTVYTTRIEADQKYPTLLANGNLVGQGELPDGRHFAEWHDPTHKPSYLYACVIGQLAKLSDQFVTRSGRPVALEFYALGKDLPKCQVAMQALKDSMKWDEDVYGREYDLDNYMVVATSQFNMGAMENKGLNIFNTACVLSSPETTTDNSNFYVKTTIAHEYFHNWTGNRITCRDWFQLSLKEGLTVFRDQSFANTLQSAAVQRIDTVNTLRAHQFGEDAGPLAHPPRPDHFVEINNFYTSTVYNKGAEICRMIAGYLGPEAYRRGTDRYFERFDGQAVTIENFLDALSEGSGVDVRPFLQWYIQPGTPSLIATPRYDHDKQQFILHLRQSHQHFKGYPDNRPVPVPVSLALFDRTTRQPLYEGQVMLEQPEQEFVFDHIPSDPVLSILRDFSAPVNISYGPPSLEDMAFLMASELNGFNQWQAAQQLYDRILLSGEDEQVLLTALPPLVATLAESDPLLAAKMLELPTENYLGTKYREHVPENIHLHREQLLNQIARALAPQLVKLYQSLVLPEYEDTAHAMGQRALRNALLLLLYRVDPAQAETFARSQYQDALCMTERLGALRALVWNGSPLAEKFLEDFLQRFGDEELVVDLWFAVQATSPLLEYDALRKLFDHPRFDLSTPNRIRAITSHFATQPAKLWNMQGVVIYLNLVRLLDRRNPILASRILQHLSRWYTLTDPLRSDIRAALVQLRTEVQSGSVVETLDHLIQAGE